VVGRPEDVHYRCLVDLPSSRGIRRLRRDPFRPLALGSSSLPIVPGWTGIDR
jgi:hypothetical protein